MAAPFGVLGISVVDGRLTAIDFLAADTPLLAPVDDATRKICEHLVDYLAEPKTVLNLPVTISGTPFQQRVWRAIQGIPAGEALTYAELAERVGSGARAVANACGANRIPLVIPCHRVVAKHGLGGFMQGREPGSLSIKQWLLNHERRKPAVA